MLGDILMAVGAFVIGVIMLSVLIAAGGMLVERHRHGP